MQDLALPSYVHGKIWLHTAQFLVWFFLLVPFFWTPCSWVTYYSGYSYQSSIKLNFKLILFIWDYHLNLHFLMWSIYEKLIYFDWLGHQEPKKLAHCETPSPIIRQSLKKRKKDRNDCVNNVETLLEFFRVLLSMASMTDILEVLFYLCYLSKLVISGEF